MTINLSPPTSDPLLKPRITVVGVGGAGGNAVNNMIRSNLEGVEFLVANTDSQALLSSKAEKTIQLGHNVTQGLGAGSRPEIGRAAAEEVIDDIIDHLQGSNMVFITGGMGGGTGTGAAPVIAEACRNQGILTVGVVTKPFHFEGAHRMRIAEAGIEELQQFVDTLIIIPNQNLFRIANEKTTFSDAFDMADDVLHAGVRGVTDLMIMPGLINLDFADIRTVMSEMGKAMMGTGEATGDRRAIEAAEAAISNPLLEDASMEGARGVLINITGGLDMTLFEVDEAANRIRSEVEVDANIIFGSTFDDSLEGVMRVSVVATGIKVQGAEADDPAEARATLSLVGGADKDKGRDAKPADKPRSSPLFGTFGGGGGNNAGGGQANGGNGRKGGRTAPVAEPSFSGFPPRQAPGEAVPATAEAEHLPVAGEAGAAGPSSQQLEYGMTDGATALAPTPPILENRVTASESAAPEEDQMRIPQPVRTTATEAFIPRQPEAVERQPHIAPGSGWAPGPQAPAEGEKNGAGSMAKSLFQKVTGMSLGNSDTPSRPQTSAVPGRLAPSRPAIQRQGQTRPTQARPTQARPTQPRLGGVDPADRPVSQSQNDPDLLDIPAFLRRQAN